MKKYKLLSFFSLLADEVTDCANLELVSIVIRFVDRNKEIRKKFLGFLTLECIMGDVLSRALVNWPQTHEIDITSCRGQGYDGTSCISSSNVGVQAKIREVSPLAFYTHCQSHQLNLCAVKAYSIPQIRNASGIVSEIAKFFSLFTKAIAFF